MEDGVRWWEAGMGGEMITDEVDSEYINAQSALKGRRACFYRRSVFLLCLRFYVMYVVKL